VQWKIKFSRTGTLLSHIISFFLYYLKSFTKHKLTWLYTYYINLILNDYVTLLENIIGILHEKRSNFRSIYIYMLPWKPEIGECRHSPVNVSITKYVGERSNISLRSCTFGPSPVYVDNHRYALVDVEKRGCDFLSPAKSFVLVESVSFVNLMQGLIVRATFS